MNKVFISIVFVYLLMPVLNGQECTDTVGSLSHDNNVVVSGQTFILADYTVPCNATVVAWEFCYQILHTSVTFYPGIWRITGTSGNSFTDYALVQSNSVTYDQSVQDPQNLTNNFPCQIFNLSDTDQFTTPAGSVVGLYSGIQFTQLLHTNTDNSITTYQFSGNQSSVRAAGNSDDVNYNIAIGVHLNIWCDDLSVPANGEISSCSSGRVGVGYEGDTCSFTCNTDQCSALTNPQNGNILCSLGDDEVPSYKDTCSFTCNTGYELTGSDTRTCQSDGSWNGTNSTCERVSCSSLTNPNNGTINCSLGDDMVPSYEDTCNFTCNTGYELTGSDTRTCQNDGSWNGTNSTCERVSCLLLTVPNDGMIGCSLGGDGIPSYKDTCNFTCNTGYELTGSDTRTCQSDGSWSGIDSVCRRISTSDTTTVTPTTSIGSTSDTTTVTSTTSIVSTSDTTTVTPTTSIGSTSDTTTVTPTTSIGSTSDASTVTPTTPSSNDVPLSSGSSSNTSAIIGGAVGGAILLLIIIVLMCSVILCMKRSHRKSTFPVDNKVHSKNANISMEKNPAYDVTTVNTMEHLYNTIKAGDSGIPITANPSYAAPTKPSKASEDECNYTQPNECNEYLDLEDTIKMDTNPSYGVTTGDRTTASKPKSSHNATTKDYDYAYVHDDHLLYHNKATSTIEDSKKDYKQIPVSVDQSLYMDNVHQFCEANNVQTSNKSEYGVVNQPKSDGPDYKIT